MAEKAGFMNFLAYFVTTTIGRSILIGVGGLIGLWAFGAYKERSGYNACKIEWRAAEKAAVDRAKDARIDGERDAGNAGPRELQNDRHNRDND